MKYLCFIRHPERQRDTKPPAALFSTGTPAVTLPLAVTWTIVSPAVLVAGPRFTNSTPPVETSFSTKEGTALIGNVSVATNSAANTASVVSVALVPGVKAAL